MAQPQGPAQPADEQGDPSQQGQQAPQQGGQDQGGGAISQLLDQVGGALQHLAQVFAASKSLPDQDKQMMSQIVQMYGEMMESLSGQGDDQGQEGQAQGQTAPMEAAGNKGAVPAM